MSNVRNKDTRTTSLIIDVVLVFSSLTLNIFTFSNVSTVDFEQVNVCRDTLSFSTDAQSIKFNINKHFLQ